MNYWQIGVGASGRDYSEIFFRHGLACVGGDKHVATMDKVELGDIILMKKGVKKILAVGKVVEREGKFSGKNDKDWLRDFDGWDLRAYCYVDWHKPEKPVNTSGLTQWTINKVSQQHLIELANKLLASAPVQQSIEPEPQPTEKIKYKDMVKFLICQGLRPSAAEELTATFNRIHLLANYYYHECYHEWDDIREHETRTFLIIPLLLSLGWAEQQIKIELPVKNSGRADIACYSKPYHSTNKNNDKNCVLLLESKGFSQGLKYAPKQVKAYASQFPNCRVVVVSNGYCYKAYNRDQSGQFSVMPSAYMNLLNPRSRYPLNPENVEGCLKALQLLLPTTWL